MSLLENTQPYMRREAEFGADNDARIAQAYRYSLLRCWDADWDEKMDPAMYFVLLNPSTADHEIDDPTATRCVGFARTCGFKALYIVNMYALRTTQPKHLWEHRDPVGPENGLYLSAILQRSMNIGGVVVAGWGAGAREAEVGLFRDMAEEHGASVWCLGTNNGGSPKHPLYLPANRALERWV